MSERVNEWVCAQGAESAQGTAAHVCYIACACSGKQLPPPPQNNKTATRLFCSFISQAKQNNVLPSWGLHQLQITLRPKFKHNMMVVRDRKVER